jgi:hypothetical protein
MTEMETRVWRVGIVPLFILSLNLSRSEIGGHCNVSIHIYKFGLHFGLSAIN